MKCCTAKRCYAVVNFSFVMFWANVYCLWVFFLRNKPGETVSDDTILTCIYTIFSRKFEIDNPDFSPVWNNLGKVETISVFGIPHWGCPKRWEYGNGDAQKRGDAHITVTLNCDTAKTPPCFLLPGFHVPFAHAQFDLLCHSSNSRGLH